MNVSVVSVKLTYGKTAPFGIRYKVVDADGKGVLLEIGRENCNNCWASAPVQIEVPDDFFELSAYDQLVIIEARIPHHMKFYDGRPLSPERVERLRNMDESTPGGKIAVQWAKTQRFEPLTEKDIRRTSINKG